MGFIIGPVAQAVRCADLAPHNVALTGDSTRNRRPAGALEPPDTTSSPVATTVPANTEPATYDPPEHGTGMPPPARRLRPGALPRAGRVLGG